MTLDQLLAPETKGINFRQSGAIALKERPCLQTDCHFGVWDGGKCKYRSHAVCPYENQPTIFGKA